MNLQAKQVWSIITPITIVYATGDHDDWDPDDGGEPHLSTDNFTVPDIREGSVVDFESYDAALKAIVSTHKEKRKKYKTVPDEKWGGTKIVDDGFEETDVPNYAVGSYIINRTVLVDLDS